MAPRPLPPEDRSTSKSDKSNRKVQKLRGKAQSHARARGQHKGGVLRSLGLGLIAGAADDDPSAIGTYGSAGAKFGPAFLWTAPVTAPMMFAVVYLCGKVGQFTGEGLFAVIRQNYPSWILYFFVFTAVTGNIIEAAADIGGMAAALNLLIPIPIGWIVLLFAAILFALPTWISVCDHSQHLPMASPDVAGLRGSCHSRESGVARRRSRNSHSSDPVQ